MPTVTQDQNPYRSPRQIGSTSRVQVRPNPGPPQARLDAGKLLFRRVVIQSPFEAIVEFEGRSLQDVVRVNNEIVVSRTSWWRITPRLDAEILVGEEVTPLTVRLRLGAFLRWRGFRIESGQQVLYAEGEEF